MEYDRFEVFMERGIKIKTKYNRRAPPSVKKIRHHKSTTYSRLNN